MFDAFTLFVVVNVDVALYPRRLLNDFVTGKALEHEEYEVLLDQTVAHLRLVALASSTVMDCNVSLFDLIQNISESMAMISSDLGPTFAKLWRIYRLERKINRANSTVRQWHKTMRSQPRRDAEFSSWHGNFGHAMKCIPPRVPIGFLHHFYNRLHALYVDIPQCCTITNLFTKVYPDEVHSTINSSNALYCPVVVALADIIFC